MTHINCKPSLFKPQLLTDDYGIKGKYVYYYLTKLCGYDVLNMEEILSNHKMFSNYDVYCVMQWQCLNVKFDNVSLTFKSFVDLDPL